MSSPSEVMKLNQGKRGNRLEISRCQQEQESCAAPNLAWFIMAEVDLWWTKGYPVYSLAELHTTPIYLRFLSMTAPYNYSLGPQSESFRSDEKEAEYRWENQRQGECERLTHALLEDEWTYEHGFKESECDTVLRTVLKPESEAGEIKRIYLTSTIIETWERGVNRTYSKVVTEGEIEHGFRSFREGNSGEIGWYEVFYNAPEVQEIERVMNHGKAQSGETKHVHGPYSWGEIWSHSDDREEKKTWHNHGGKEWGHIHGSTDCKVWDNHWEIAPEARNEERLLTDNGRYRGFQDQRQGRDWQRIDWEGANPRPPFLHESSPVTDKELPGKLKSAVTNEYDNALESLSTLRMMLDLAPELKEEGKALEAEVDKAGGELPQDVTGLVTRLSTYQDLTRRLERLKRRILEAIRQDYQKYQSAHEPLEVLATSSLETMSSVFSGVEEPEVGSGLSDLRTEAEGIRHLPGPYYTRIKAWTGLLKRINDFTIAKIPKDAGLNKEQVDEAVKTLYKLSTMQEAAVIRLSELVPDPKEAEAQEQFSEEYSHLIDNERSESFLQQLLLVLKRQEAAFRLIEKLKGTKPESIDEDYKNVQTMAENTSKHPNPRGIKRLVRTGTVSPITQLNPVLDKLTTSLLRLFKTTDPNPEDLSSIRLLEEGMLNPHPESPIPALMTRAKSITTASSLLGGYLGSLHRCLRFTDKDLAQLLNLSAEVLTDLHGPESIIETDKRLSKAVFNQSWEGSVIEKGEQLRISLHAIKSALKPLQDALEELAINNDELDELLRQKSEEIIFLTKEIDNKEKKMRDRQEELLTLRRFKAKNVEKAQDLETALGRVRELESGVLPIPPVARVPASQTHSLRYLFEVLRKRSNTSKAVFLEQWKSAVPDPVTPSTIDDFTLLPDTAWPPASESENFTESEAKEMKRADQPLAEVRTTLLRSNPLIRSVELSGVVFASPMTEIDFYRYLEACFRAKLTSDEEELRLGRRPVTFPAFFLTHTIELQGSKEKGNQHLSRLLPSILSLYALRQPYAVFIARLLNVLDPHPAVLEAEIIALQYWQRLSYTRIQPENSLSLGGVVGLIPVLETYYPEFIKDLTLLPVWLERIKPINTSEERFGLILIYWRIKKSGISPDQFISKLKVPYQRVDFSSALKDQLSLVLPKAVFTAVWTYLKETDSALTSEKMNEVLEAGEGTEQVRVADFLTGVLDLHEFKRKKVAREVLRAFPTPPTSRETFIDTYKRIDPVASEEQASEVAEQVLTLSPDEPYRLASIVQVLALHPPPSLRSGLLVVDSLHENLETRSFETSLDKEDWETPAKRTRLIRTTETTVKTVRKVLKSRRIS